MKTDQAKPVKIPIEPEEETKASLPITEQELQKLIPKGQLIKARLLLKYIADNPDIKWNDKNELVYKGQTIPNSNFHDLFQDLVRNLRKAGRPPKGFDQLAQALKDQNVPLTAIGHEARRRHIADEVIEEGPSEETPKTPKIKRSVRKKKVLWDSLDNE